MPHRLSHRRLYLCLYRREYIGTFEQGVPRWGFTRRNEHTFSVLHLGKFNLVFGVKPMEWFIDAPGDSAHENH